MPGSWPSTYMSPKAKKKRPARKPPLHDRHKRQVENIACSCESTGAYIRSLVSYFRCPDTTCELLCLFLLSKQCRKQPRFQNNWGDAILLSTVLFSVNSRRLCNQFNRYTQIDANIPETKEQKRIGFITAINAITVACTTISYTFLLKGGYLEGLTTFLQANIFPMLSRGVNYLLSNIIGWAVSGIVGNFCYDLIKRKFRGTEDNIRNEIKKG